MICFGASTLQKKALNNQNTGQNWVPGIFTYIYIYINLGDVAIFSLYMWLAVCHSFVQGSQLDFPPGSACGPSKTNSNRWMLENLELLKDDGILNFMAAMKLWSLCNWKENLIISLYTYIDALRKYDPQIVLKQWWWWVPMVQKWQNRRHVPGVCFCKKTLRNKKLTKEIRSFGCSARMGRIPAICFTSEGHGGLSSWECQENSRQTEGAQKGCPCSPRNVTSIHTSHDCIVEKWQKHPKILYSHT